MKKRCIPHEIQRLTQILVYLSGVEPEPALL